MKIIRLRVCDGGCCTGELTLVRLPLNSPREARVGCRRWYDPLARNRSDPEDGRQRSLASLVGDRRQDNHELGRVFSQVGAMITYVVRNINSDCQRGAGM